MAFDGRLVSLEGEELRRALPCCRPLLCVLGDALPLTRVIHRQPSLVYFWKCKWAPGSSVSRVARWNGGRRWLDARVPVFSSCFHVVVRTRVMPVRMW